MILYIVEAHFYDGENDNTNLISVRYDKQEAENDKLNYETIMSNNLKLAQSDYDVLMENYNKDESEWLENLLSKFSYCEQALYSDFYSVTITEVELDKLLYKKEDLIYVSVL
jgi:hypothetical protein